MRKETRGIYNEIEKTGKWDWYKETRKKYDGANFKAYEDFWKGHFRGLKISPIYVRTLNDLIKEPGMSAECTLLRSVASSDPA